MSAPCAAPQRGLGDGCDALAPVSVNQDERLTFEWLAGLRGRRFAPFHVPVCLQFEGRLSIAKLERALNAVVARHDGLRATFPGAASPERDRRHEMFRRVSAVDGWRTPSFSTGLMATGQVSVSVESVDDSEPDHGARLRPRLEAEIRKPFSYDRAPLLHATVYQGRQGCAWLLIVCHHLIVDGWASQLLVDEILEAYQRETHRPGALPQAPSYFRFVQAQREALDSADAQSRLDSLRASYVRAAAAGLTFDDFDGLRAADAGERDGLHLERLDFGHRASHALRTYCRQRRISLYMLVLAALNGLCHLRTGRDRVAMWIALRNRSTPDTDGLIGWTAESRLTCSSVEPSLCFETLVAAARDTVVNAAADEWLPLAAIRHGHGHQSVNHEHALRLLLEVSNRYLAERRPVGDGLTVRRIRLPYTSAENLLKVFVESATCVGLSCLASRRRVSESGARTLLRQLQTLVMVGVDQPYQAIGSLAEPFRRDCQTT